MIVEITSRVLAVIAAVAFTLVFTTGRLPVIPKGRWTVVSLFVLGLALCTVAGTRDGTASTLTQPHWLTATFTALGLSAVGVMLAVMAGLNWRFGVVGLAGVTATSWLLALGYAVLFGLGTALLGVATLFVAAGASLVVWSVSASRPRSHRQALS